MMIYTSSIQLYNFTADSMLCVPQNQNNNNFLLRSKYVKFHLYFKNIYHLISYYPIFITLIKDSHYHKLYQIKFLKWPIINTSNIKQIMMSLEIAQGSFKMHVQILNTWKNIVFFL